MDIVATQRSQKIFSYTAQKNGVAFDLDSAGVTRIEVVVAGEVLSSDLSGVSFTGTTLSIQWGLLPIAVGTYPVVVWVYNAVSPEGEILLGNSDSPITLTMNADTRPHLVTVSSSVSTLSLRGASKPIRKLVINGETIDFGLYEGNINTLTALPITWINTTEQESILTTVNVPRTYTHHFTVTFPKNITKTYVHTWVV